jgi:4-amino-4-deoxy-L-arabinose transferase-like glycosyltransferase
MNIKFKNILLPLILILAILLRFYNIDQIPSLNPDEAALGYNAYSLLNTGKDEHGVSWPLHFKSFGDYKPGGYVYLDLPFTALFGLTPLATRLPNLILSVLAILYLYKFVYLLSKNKNLALLSALTLTISPWHIHFSRGAWESSVALSLILIAIYYFYKYIEDSKLRHIYLFVLLIVTSLYTYHSARLVAPLLTLVLITLHFKTLLSRLKNLIIPLILGILITLPVLFSFLNNGGTTRLGGVGLMADYGPIARAEELLNQHSDFNIANRIIHNKRLLYVISWSEKYLSHYDLNFLFTKGDEVPRSKTPNMGQLYLIELPLLLLGLYFLFHSKIFTKKTSLFLISFLLISPVASSLTFQAPSALRGLPLVVPLSILISIGLYQTFLFINSLSTNKKYISYFLVALLYSYSLSNYLTQYFIHSPQTYPFAWNSKFEEVVPYINSQKNDYQNIYLTDTYDQPYILYLYYSKYDPKTIQSQIKLSPPDKFGFSTVRQIDNIHFQNLSDFSTLKPNSLIINDSKDIPGFSPTKIINFTNGNAAFKIYTN